MRGSCPRDSLASCCISHVAVPMFLEMFRLESDIWREADIQKCGVLSRRDWETSDQDCFGVPIDASFRNAVVCDCRSFIRDVTLSKLSTSAATVTLTVTQEVKRCNEKKQFQEANHDHANHDVSQMLLNGIKNLIFACPHTSPSR